MKHPGRVRVLWTTIIGVPLLWVAIVGLQMRIDSQTRSTARQAQELLLRSPSAIKKMSLGYDSLLADIYWTRAVQYYGSRSRVEGSDFDQLWPLLDITTTLDPELVIAYRFGAVFLAEPVSGAGRTDLAVALVKRGIAANPGEWRLSADLGFLYYWKMRDYGASAAAFLEGAKNPKAPAWLKMMAARVLQKGGSLETSRMIWSEIYETNQNEKIRDYALTMLRGLKAEEDELRLDEIAAEYQKRFGRWPNSTSELRSVGLLAGIPTDPMGYPYIFGPDGEAQLDPQSPVVIPKEPQGPPQATH